MYTYFLHIFRSLFPWSRHLPDIQTVAKLQQGLQQVYCMHGIETGHAVLSEPNAMSYMPGATCLQLFQASVNFADMSAINCSRIPPVPRDKIMVQVRTQR